MRIVCQWGVLNTRVRQLWNPGLRTKGNEGCREASDGCREASFFHDAKYDWDRNTTHKGGKRSNADIGNMRLGIAVANFLEVE